MVEETPLNGAQIAEVQKHVARAIEQLRVRQWAVEQVLKAATPPDKVVDLARQISDFVNYGEINHSNPPTTEIASKTSEHSQDYSASRNRAHNYLPHS